MKQRLRRMSSGHRSISGGAATQTCTASVNANNDDGCSPHSTTEPGIEPSADSGRRSTGTAAGNAASNINNDDMRAMH